MGPAPKKIPPEKRPFKGEDPETVQKILDGENVPIEVIMAIQENRANEGRPYLVIHPTTYEHDKEKYKDLNINAEEIFKFKRDTIDGYLRGIASLGDEREERLPEICNNVNKALNTDPEEKKKISHELGEWFGDYLLDNGYEAQIDGALLKTMINAAFPPIKKGDEEYTPENLERNLLNSRNVYGQYVGLRDTRKYTLQSVLGNGDRIMFYG